MRPKIIILRKMKNQCFESIHAIYNISHTNIYIMKNTIITLIGSVKGNIFNFVDICLPFSREDQTGYLPDYRVTKMARNQSRNGRKCGVYISSDGKTVFLKRLSYKRKNIEYYKIMNEANILETFENWRYTGNGGFDVSFPKIKKIVRKNGELIIVQELIEGVDLKSASIETKKSVIKNCLYAMKDLSLKIGCGARLGIRKVAPIFFLITFPFYWMKMIFRDPVRYSLHVKILSIFFRQIFSSWIFFPNYIFAHKDLHSENVMVREKSIAILDLELCAFADEMTDLAIIAMHYQKEIGLENIMEILTEFIKNDIQKKKFLALTSYYSVLTLATCKKEESDYLKAEEYLQVLAGSIAPILELKY